MEKRYEVMTSSRLSILIIGIFFLLAARPCQAGFADFFSKAKDSLFGNSDSAGDILNSTDIIQGLKEALNVGTVNAIGNLSKADGFLSNPDVKILLPKSVKKVESLLRTVGYGEQVDQFELSMNRAAERAVPEAKNIFGEAIKKMTIDDAKKILNGKENEATLYFKEKASGRLRELFKPIAHEAMSEVGVTKSYQDINQKLALIPMSKKLNLDLDEYVTEKSLDGLFLMIAEEEKKIRTDPAARVTDLLKKVFQQ